MIPLDSHILSACVTPEILITFMTFQPFDSFSLTGPECGLLPGVFLTYVGNSQGPVGEGGEGWERRVDLGIHYFATHAKYKLNRSKCPQASLLYT